MSRHAARPELAAHMDRRGALAAATLTLAAGAAWAAQHAVHAAGWANGQPARLAAVWMITFGLLLMQTLMYHLERPRVLTARTARQLEALHVAVICPAYNEDPGYLRLGLESLLRQTRLPNSVHVVDDGSTSTDYAQVRAWWEQAARAAGIRATWQRTPNRGKRHAQAAAVEQAPHADVFVTIDSDACLSPDALGELLAPFAKADVQSVAGVVIASNNRGPAARPAKPRGRDRKDRRAYRAQLVGYRASQLLCRITDLWFVTGQLVDRSALSAMGSVLVNSGPLAAYRAPVVRDNLDAYLSETFMGRPVMFSDDSLLTLYALLRGRTVQQPSAIVFTAMPERAGHLLRMYLRWMRGSTIRSLWRLRYLPLNRWAYWAHLMRWFQLALATTVMVWLLGVEPIAYGQLPPWQFALVPVLIGWAQGLRYLALVRSDESTASRVATWLLMPLAVAWAWTVLRAMRWYGMATCARTGWGTRQHGAEVSLEPAATVAMPAVRRGDDTVPLLKLRDPHDETTLTVAAPVRAAN